MLKVALGVFEMGGEMFFDRWSPSTVGHWVSLTEGSRPGAVVSSLVVVVSASRCAIRRARWLSILYPWRVGH